MAVIVREGHEGEHVGDWSADPGDAAIWRMRQSAAPLSRTASLIAVSTCGVRSDESGDTLNADWATVARTVAIGMLIVLAGTIPRNILLAANLRFLRSHCAGRCPPILASCFTAIVLLGVLATLRQSRVSDR
jgi:hypothetical protein